MKISLRILLGYVLIVAVGAWFVLRIFVNEVKPGVRQVMEDTLVDTANVLAPLAAADLAAGHIADGAFAHALQNIEKQPVQARVWNVVKRQIDYRVYVTNLHGIVVFDSTGLDLGRDFSRWNDVHLTLQGKYGVRSTRSDPKDDTTSVMHVAAPIRQDGQIIGVLTVAKPNKAVAPFVETGRRKILMAGLWLLLVSLTIGVAVALWITGSLQKLLDYAERVSKGEKVEPPDLGKNELGTLSRALAGMREKLEGKQYVERYVHALTHEMKSPLTAIAASAELLEEDVPREQRKRFVGNVREQTERLRQLVDRALGLASVESKQRLENVAPVELEVLLAELLAERETQLAARRIRVDTQQVTPQRVQGDRFLLGQALANLLDNAMAFSPEGGEIQLVLRATETGVELTVADEGQGVPDYALGRVFERFFSLERPSTGKKSTGLGLPFVREVVELHGGVVMLQNRAEGGAVAVVRFQGK